MTTMIVNVKITGDIRQPMEKIARNLSASRAKTVLRAATHAGGVIARNVVADSKDGKGKLARSFLPAKFLDKGQGAISAGAMSSLVYAGIQDEGGVIKPRTVKNLAIPLDKNSARRWPRDWPEGQLFPITSKAGNHLLVERIGKGKTARIKPRYLLKDSVTIKGKQYIKKSVDDATPGIQEIVNAQTVADVEKP